MRYREVKPNPQLATYVECFWTLESDSVAHPSQSEPPETVQPERILPDGCVELILNFGAQFREQKDDGQHEAQPMHFLVGQMTRPMLISPNGPVELIGIRFHPGGTVPFFRFDMQEVTNRVVELAALSGGLERKLLSRMDEARSLPYLALRIAMLEAVLVEMVRDSRHKSRLTALAAKIVDRGGQLTVDQLSVDAGLSSRQLERKFLSEVGIGPKLLCRILRFQQVFRAIEQNDAGSAAGAPRSGAGAEWAMVAADCGYYDQAHLIRDFQQFARQTPAVLISDSRPLTEAFTRKDRVSDFSNTLA